MGMHNNYNFKLPIVMSITLMRKVENRGSVTWRWRNCKRGNNTTRSESSGTNNSDKHNNDGGNGSGNDGDKKECTKQ